MIADALVGDILPLFFACLGSLYYSKQSLICFSGYISFFTLSCTVPYMWAIAWQVLKIGVIICREPKISLVAYAVPKVEVVSCIEPKNLNCTSNTKKRSNYMYSTKNYGNCSIEPKIGVI